MAVCLVPPLPAVNIALEHLGELDKQLRAEGVAFSREASHHLREIADAIKELEASRKASHEELEVETIETGKLRHRLLSQRDGIVAEISAAVAAARAANAAEFNCLQVETANAVQEIESMEKRRKLLEEQNVLLLPEHHRLDGVYAELIEQLNRQLSENVVTQITLNEVKKEIQTTREKIARVHSIRKDLQENLMRDRKQFEESKKMLGKEIDETINTIYEQSKTNSETQNQLAVALTELVRKEERVVELSNQLSLSERRSDRLTASRQKHEEQIKNKINKSDELTKQRELREKELKELRETLNRQLLRLQENIEAVEREIEEEQKQSSVRLDALAKLSSMFQAQKKKEDDAQMDHSRLKTDLENSKQRLDECFASIAKSKLEIKAMEQEIKHLHEANNVEMFKRNLVELQRRLAKEKQSRAAFEIEKEELCVRIETLKEHHEDSVTKLRSAVSLHKTRYSLLTEEKKKQEQEQDVLSSLIEELIHRISKAEEEHQQAEIEYNNEIQRLNMEVESIAQAHLDEELKLKDQESMLSNFEALFNINHSRHQTLEQQIIELKGRRSHLELSIQEEKERTAATLQPKEDLKKELQTLRENHKELLRSHAGQIITMERSVYENGLMLEQVKMENGRLHLCLERMKMDVVNGRTEKEKHAQEMSWMKEEVQSIYRSLADAWSKDKLATEESAEKDQKLLDAMQMFRLRVQERKTHVGAINMKLEAELKAMSALLEISNSQQK